MCVLFLKISISNIEAEVKNLSRTGLDMIFI